MRTASRPAPHLRHLRDSPASASPCSGNVAGHGAISSRIPVGAVGCLQLRILAQGAQLSQKDQLLLELSLRAFPSSSFLVRFSKLNLRMSCCSDRKHLSCQLSPTIGSK